MNSVGRTIDENQIETLTSVLDSMYPVREKIARTLDRFLAYNEDPRECNFVREEIAESWIRSRSYGITQDIDLSSKRVKPSTWKRVLKNSGTLLSVAKEILLKDLSFVTRHSDFSAFLFDDKGITLLPVNGGKTFSSVVPGLDVSEESIGTSSHSLCIYHDTPTFLVAPENFNWTIQDVSASVSVPIHYENGTLAGVLTFTYNRDNDLYLTSREMLSGMIAFQFSLVQKIENSLKGLEDNPKTSPSQTQNYLLFEIIRSLTDACLVAVNRKGEFLHINIGAEKLLQATIKQLKGTNIIAVTGNELRLIDALKSNKSTPDFPIQLFSNGNPIDCVMRVVPVNDNEAIIRFKQLKSSKPNNSENLSAIYTFSDIAGESPELARTKQLAQKFASTSRNIILFGRSGTGKELFAQAIHNASRSQGPFISINCASLPRGLVESEFFGYEGGSFTGADRKGRAGKLELADGGTLFLDEIGDMPLGFQPILLRALENKQVMRIGGNQYVPTNFRVIAATNKDIPDLISRNLFREDLYYRLSSLKLLIPSLKERRNDILVLAHYFIHKQCQEYNLPIPTIEPDVEKALISYEWPGNIRELHNCIGTALTLAEDGVIKVEDLPPEILSQSYDVNETFEPKTLDEMEETAIRDVMFRTGHNVSKAARFLGINRTTLYQKLKKYHISTI
ncbi:transcriptional regulator with PAS, ATPase and Fis domain [Desulfitobacterium sp. LBE]|uniref:Signal-transduction and transcriptional-control protein n=1 Tax=Desulfitobacterium hafniense TaxID=49338 RepID=A0A098B7X4_DESHA|nr:MULTISPECIES: sigma 54-interacting transcriptional regulator [Desulfitobacterium]TWH57946.1 transcriptional regulator with PAS, ATPase and Fis domain [Desulfitobacterium sp. LBE]CDX04472.1 Signal-transduction and transcriptional-control protein [Desulfitobacterium hafniense]